MSTIYTPGMFHYYMIVLPFDNLMKNTNIVDTQKFVLALQTAIGAYHFREFLIGTPYEISIKQIYKACPDYAIVRDMCNLGKHRILTEGQWIVEPDVTKAYDDHIKIILRPGSPAQLQGVFKIKLKNGTTRDIKNVLCNVVNFWQEQSFKHQWRANKKLYLHDGIKWVDRT